MGFDYCFYRWISHINSLDSQESEASPCFRTGHLGVDQKWAELAEATPSFVPILSGLRRTASPFIPALPGGAFWRRRVKEKIMNQSESETVNEEDVIISDMISLRGQEQTKEQETTPIYKFNNIVEAMAIKTMLEENNIACIVTSFEDLAYDGMYQVQKGWGMLQVFESDREKAEELIKTYLEEQAKEAKNLSIPEKAQEPITEPSEKKLGSNLLFKIVAVVLVVNLLSGLLFALVWLIWSLF